MGGGALPCRSRMFITHLFSFSLSLLSLNSSLGLIFWLFPVNSREGWESVRISVSSGSVGIQLARDQCRLLAVPFPSKSGKLEQTSGGDVGRGGKRKTKGTGAFRNNSAHNALNY